jgi:hypothetical protein
MASTARPIATRQRNDSAWPQPTSAESNGVSHGSRGPSVRAAFTEPYPRYPITTTAPIVLSVSIPDCIGANFFIPVTGLRRSKLNVSASGEKFHPPWMPCAPTPATSVATAIGATRTVRVIRP